MEELPPDLAQRPLIEQSIDERRKLNTCLLVLNGQLRYREIAELLILGYAPIEIARELEMQHVTVRGAVIRMRMVLNLSKAVARR